MSLCRLYPLASDRMAIMWSLMPIEGAICLEYGPAGTTHFGGGLYSSLGISLKNTLFTTHISEDDVVMGDVTRLEQAIVELDQAYAPKVIFVVASAVIAVIGTDIKGVCQYMQEKVQARLIAFDDGGFRGDYTYGLRAVYRLLTKELVVKSMLEHIDEESRTADTNQENMLQKREKTYQILGASAGSYRIRSDVWELQQLMTEAFGWRCHMVMGLECSIDDMMLASTTSLNLVIRQEALEAADILQENCEIPYVYGVPYGYRGTLTWLEEIAAIIGEEINPKLRERLQKKIRELQPMGGPMGNFSPRPFVASIQGDYDTVVGMSTALQELDIAIDHRICSHSLKTITEENHKKNMATQDMTYFPKEKERIDCLRTLQGQWLLGSLEMQQLCVKDNYITCISAPFVGKPQISNHLPFMGEKGMDYLRELKEEYSAWLAGN